MTRKFSMHVWKAVRSGLFIAGVLFLTTLSIPPVSAEEKGATKKAKKPTSLNDPVLRAREMAVVSEIHAKILATSKGMTEAGMKTYQVNLPAPPKSPYRAIQLPAVSFSMIAIKGGRFKMGSPASEPERNSDEGPQRNVKVDPFWMQQCEVTWNEYEAFMSQDHRDVHGWKTNSIADAVAHPSKPYIEMSFGMGKGDFPA